MNFCRAILITVHVIIATGSRNVTNLGIKLYAPHSLSGRFKRATASVELTEARLGHYFGVVFVGRDRQLIHVVFDTTTGLTWVPKVGGHWSKYHEFYPGPASDAVLTGRQFSKEYLLNIVEGEWMWVDLEIGDIKLSQLTIGLASRLYAKNPTFGTGFFPGVVGLQFDGDTPYFEKTLLGYLFESRNIASPQFTLSFQ
ncbi:hypothetical protein CRM22_010280 [Opisthorchis felineus]|uniref:Peptidase A1 domain-containing protein n=1 Tax=Opisthorchis felineus TaxID=147828 RepID=A0A4S2L615_OPIFE|nr:hypothetical protein CRM22_010280 [Opisthorchis felineus]